MLKKMKEKNNILELDEKGDVGMFADLTSALMNLVSAETHVSMSQISDPSPKWIKLGRELREIRTKYMKLLVKKDNSQKWCMSKHLLQTAMNLIEIGNRYAEDKLDKQAEICYVDCGIILEKLFELNIGEEK